MKYLALIITVVFVSCGEVEPLCKLPPEPKGFYPIKQDNNPTRGVSVLLEIEEFFSLDDDRTYVIFSVPDVFINTSENDRGLHVSKNTEYMYKLKDTTNFPDSVTISAYLYNDCGESKKHYGVITFK